MGCSNSKGADAAVVVASSTSHRPGDLKKSSSGRIKKGSGGVDLMSIKKPSIGAIRNPSHSTSCTVSTGGSHGDVGHYVGGGVPCCAETHRSDWSEDPHHEEDQILEEVRVVEEKDDDDEDSEEEERRRRISFKQSKRRRNSVSMNELSSLLNADKDDKTAADMDAEVARIKSAKEKVASKLAELPDEFLEIDIPYDKSIEEVYSGVRDGPILGEGVCGIVRKITHRYTGEEFALKRLDLSKVGTEEELLRLKEEIYIMCQLEHPNVVKLEEVYESESELFLVGELLDGGELFDRLDEQPDFHYTEAECANLVMQMLCAVRYIHSKGIVHRDLKLENFLFESRETGARLKMIDFGLSKHFSVGDVQCEIVGTPYTVAPEVVKGRYDERCDVWGVGVLAFFLLSGDPPFGGCGGPEPLRVVRDNILSGRYEFEPREIWDDVSGDAKDFIRALLVIDPADRPTAREVQKLAWLRKLQTGRMEGSQSDLAKNDVAASIKRMMDSGTRLSGLLGNLSIINFEDPDLAEDRADPPMKDFTER